MQHATGLLEELGVAYETKIVSAHRTPARLCAYARSAKQRGLKVIIAGAGTRSPPPPLNPNQTAIKMAHDVADRLSGGSWAGGAAHLPGMTASMTPLPVLGVPVKTRYAPRTPAHVLYRRTTTWSKRL
jgi:5-(carboxyamino)imidazole ribonucleotide mutase